MTNDVAPTQGEHNTDSKNFIIKVLHGRWVTYWMHPSRFKREPLEVIRSRALVFSSLGILILSIVLAVFLFFFVDVGRGITLGLIGLGAFLLLLIGKHIDTYRISTHLACGVAYVAIFQGAYAYGGVFTPPIRWALIIPLLALLFGGVRLMFSWFGITLVTIIAMYLAPQYGFVFPTVEIPPDRLQRIHTVSYMLQFVSVVVLFLAGESLRTWLGELANQREKDLIVARDEAMKANAAKSQFLATMTHEFRTPLTTVIGYSELLLEEVEDGAPWHEDVEIIRSSGVHLLGLVEDVLDMSQAEAGVLSLKMETCTLQDTVVIAVDTVRSIAMEQNNVLTVRWEQEELAASQWQTDPGRVRQILVNLLGNAAKFTRGGNITLSISARGEEKVVLCVEDDGLGMSEALQEKVFENFIRGDMSNAGQFTGTGLGLGLVRHLTQALGGEIELESTPGEGTRVEVTLPRQVQAAS